jgi:hypothetical protein
MTDVRFAAVSDDTGARPLYPPGSAEPAPTGDRMTSSLLRAHLVRV